MQKSSIIDIQLRSKYISETSWPGWNPSYCYEWTKSFFLDQLLKSVCNSWGFSNATLKTADISRDILSKEFIYFKSCRLLVCLFNISIEFVFCCEYLFDTFQVYFSIPSSPFLMIAKGNLFVKLYARRWNLEPNYIWKETFHQLDLN